MIKLKRHISFPLLTGNDRGYTLIETLVALVLFSSVAIPLGGAIGTLLFNRQGEHIRSALLAAEGEVAVRQQTGIQGPQRRVTADHLLVRSLMDTANGLLECRVEVSSTRDSNRLLYSLSKTTLISSP